VKLAILSDIHYAGLAERERGNFFLDSISNPVRRGAVKLYRHFFWQRDAFAHNHLLDQFLNQAGTPDYVIANGDYSCDSAFIGVSDPAAYASAAECLAKLRSQFGARFVATFGDHEIGKRPLGVDLGGGRLASYHRARKELDFYLALGPALAALGRKHFIARGIVNHGDLDSAGAFECDGNAEAGIAVRVVCGPIERIDDPPPLCLSRGRLDSRSSARFFSENCVTRIVRPNAFDD